MAEHAHAGHAHAHAGDFSRAFAIGIAANLAYVAVEAFYGVAAGSVALLADAGHNLGDVLALAAAWAAAALGRREPTRHYTYGFRSTSILAALGNAIVLLVVTGGIAWEAVRRLMAPEPAAGATIAWVAALGIAVNGATALLFLGGRKGDLNLKAAFLHMAADAGVAAGVVAAGLVILFTGWQWIDPVASLAIAAAIIFATWSLLRDAVQMALHGVPQGIDPGAVEAYLAALPGVAEVHDLHIWAMSTTETALTAHLVRPEGAPDDAFFVAAARELRARFRIGHPTLQIEQGDADHPCDLAPDHVV